MDTLRLTTSSTDLTIAARLLADGGLVVFPTETVYGLGARADLDEAVRRVFEAKGRPADNPLIVHVDSLEMAREYSSALSPVEEALFRKFCPGPLTLIVDRAPSMAAAAAAGNDTLGIRFPRHPAALELIRALGAGIAAPSANRSGRPSPTDFAMALTEMDGRVAAIVDGGPSEKGLESTIVRHADDGLYILRPGTITAREIETCAHEVDRSLRVHLPAAQGHGKSKPMPAAPGTRYRHYAPEATIALVANEAELHGALAGAEPKARELVIPADWDVPGNAASTVSRITSLEDYGHRLYRIFADADRRGIQEVVCWLPEESPESHALRDRLQRAAKG